MTIHGGCWLSSSPDGHRNETGFPLNDIFNGVSCTLDGLCHDGQVSVHLVPVLLEVAFHSLLKSVGKPWESWHPRRPGSPDYMPDRKSWEIHIFRVQQNYILDKTISLAAGLL